MCFQINAFVWISLVLATFGGSCLTVLLLLRFFSVWSREGSWRCVGDKPDLGLLVPPQLPAEPSPAALPSDRVSTIWKLGSGPLNSWRDTFSIPNHWGPCKRLGYCRVSNFSFHLTALWALLCRTGALLICWSSGPDLGPPLHYLCLLASVLM